MRFAFLAVFLLYTFSVFGQGGVYFSPGLGYCAPILQSYNKTVRDSNDANKTYGINKKLPETLFALMPEIEAGYGLRLDPFVSSVHLKSGYVPAYENGASVNWPAGNTAQSVKNNFSAVLVLAGARRFGETFFESMRPYFGLEAGCLIPVSPFIEEKVYSEAGVLVSYVRKDWEGLLPVLSAETGCEIRFNQSFALAVKAGWRYARGQVSVDINDMIAGNVSKKPDILDYSGAFANLNFVFGNFEAGTESELAGSGNYEFPALAEASFKDGKSLFDRGLFAAAKLKFEECLKIAPDSAQIKDYLYRINIITNPGGALQSTAELIKEACRLEEKGKISEAYFKYSEALRYEPFNTQALGRIYAMTVSAKVFYENGTALYEKGSEKKAVKELKKACEYHPDNALYAGFLRQISDKTANKAKADKLFNEGVDHYRAEDYALAVKLWQEADALTPDDKQITGALEDAMKKIEEKRALRKEESVKVLLNAKELHAQGKTQEAVTAYEHALRLNPECAEAAEFLKQHKNGMENKDNILKKRN